MVSFLNAWVLLSIPVVLLFILWLVRKDFVSFDTRFSEEVVARKKHARMRRFVLITRTIIFTCLLLALATPVLTTDFFSETDPRIVVLVDESESMNVFAATNLIEELSELARVEQHVIATGNTSALGDAILTHIGVGSHVVLISDGRLTSGASLASVASFAENQQATINAVELPRRFEDASVQVEVESLVIENIQTPIHVRVHTTDGVARAVQVLVNNEVVDERETSTSFTLSQAFSSRENTVTARILTEDEFMSNNEFTATVTATTKPRVLLIASRSSAFEGVLKQLYSVDTKTTIPTSLDKYAAIVVFDTPRSALDEQALVEYVTAGGGLIVIGGERSFEFGGYRNSLLESLLPVRVGVGASAAPSANIVLAIDMSNRALGSVAFVDGEQIRASQEVQSVQKALAIDLLNRLNKNNRVGALAFTYPLPDQHSCTGACVLAPIRSLGEHQEELIDRVARVNITGGTSISTGVQGSIQLLEQVSGSQNIVLISDGVTGVEDANQALNAARTFAARGGTLYAVHVGNSEQGLGFLQELATATGGVAFVAGANNRLAVLFGEPQESEGEDAFALIPVDEYHFITRGITPSATLFGSNQVLVKRGARQLLATNNAQPVLTVWNYGVGRVGAITAFSNDDLGALLHAPNSEYISRLGNWAIGPLERIQQTLILVEDVREGEEALVVARGERPLLEAVAFSRVARNEYEANLPARNQGVHEVLGTRYAVNYPSEFDALGISDELREAVNLSGGDMYAPNDAQQILKHATTLSELKDIREEPLYWPFVLAALIVFLLEVLIRRVTSMRKHS
ncbi:MAG: VWA domain-containing protein [Candidatus Woesearchaeota archaeon]